MKRVRLFAHQICAQVRKRVRSGHLHAVDNFEQLPQDFVTAIPKTDARFAFFADKQNACFVSQSQISSFEHFNTIKPNFHP